MKAKIGHIGINLADNESISFWRELLNFFDFTFLVDDGEHFDATDGNTYLCVGTTNSAHKNIEFHRKRTGLNHVAFQVDSREKVNKFVEVFLEPREILPLYGGAKEYPDYASQYYAVFFEDPNRIKLEVVFESSD